MTNWPKHPDGRNKTMGEMTPEESRAVIAASCARLKAEFEHPVMQEKLAAVLSGQSVRQ
jgi:hypothetical protein